MYLVRRLVGSLPLESALSRHSRAQGNDLELGDLARLMMHEAQAPEIFVDEWINRHGAISLAGYRC
jgi:hypothetical protein